MVTASIAFVILIMFVFTWGNIHILNLRLERMEHGPKFKSGDTVKTMFNESKEFTVIDSHYQSVTSKYPVYIIMAADGTVCKDITELILLEGEKK